MYVMKINKLMVAKILVSILSAVLGLTFSTILLYRHYQRNDFINVIIMMFIYYTFTFSIGVYVFNYLANRIKAIELISIFFSSKAGLASILITMLILLVLPLGKYLADDLVLVLTLITSFCVSLLCFIYITKATR